MKKAKIIQPVIISLRDVFKRPLSFVITAVVALALILAVTILNNGQLLKVLLGTLDWFAKPKIFWFAAQIFYFNFTGISQTLYIIMAVLTGVAVAQMVFYFKKQVSTRRAAGVGFFGIIISFLGIGCSACGSILITSIFGLSATAALINFLPLHGLEFSVFGIILLLWSIWYLSFKIEQPLVCEPVSLKKIKNYPER
ncbi:MAG: hypothetical protein Q8Q23_06060 [bacterium]|nr:hypothetical protein [bacterium]